MRRILSIAAVGALAATSLALTSPAGAVATAAADDRIQPTRFGMGHHAFGTKVDGNPAVRSGPTANSVLGCTNRAGLNRQNDVLKVDGAPLVRAEEVVSRGFTRKSGRVVSVTSRNTISKGALAGGAVKFGGLSSKSRTWHDATGFHNMITQKLTRLVINGNPVPVNPGTQMIPGLGELTVFSKTYSKSPSSASARGVVLRLVRDDGTRVRVGHSYSTMLNRVFGPMGGSTWGTLVQPGDGTVSSGRSAFQVMPCRGTNGNVRENTSAGVALPGAGTADGITTRKMGVQRPAVQYGFTSARIDNASLLTDAVQISGISSQANVRRDNGGLSRSAKGTRLQSITVNGMDIRPNLVPGEAYQLPLDLGTVTFRQVTTIPNGIDVLALEIVQPDGTVIELGHSIMRIKKN